MSDYVTPDLLYLILKPLRIKDILKCRSVCKSWKEAVDSKPFIVDHLALQRRRLIAQSHDLKYLIIDPRNPRYYFPIFSRLFGPDPYENTPNLSVVATSNGVICLYNNQNILLLWNPSIRRQLRLPLPRIYHDSDKFKGSGFWINPSTNDFKVVIFYFADRKIAVFSSSKKTWTEMAMEKNPRLGERTDPQILIQEMGYWKCHARWGNGLIVSFDFMQDKFGTIEFPEVLEKEKVEEKDHYIGLVKWRDCVSFIHSRVEYLHDCDLWAMQNGSWSKVFSFHITDPVTAVLYVGDNYESVVTKPSLYCPLVIHYTGGDQDQWWLQHNEYKMSGYVSWVYDFVKSLVFPDESCIAV